ncbi:MAG: glycosyltransferase family 2 protein, partial [candidate division Zixibacteria bacterium]|nr:glycosyltransferase family 2 protein [candidate division Zixibacteria bacterium]
MNKGHNQPNVANDATGQTLTAASFSNILKTMAFPSGMDPSGSQHSDDNPITDSMATALVVPTLNAGNGFVEWLAVLKKQTVRPQRLLLIDSASTDSTVEMAADSGFEIKSIDRRDFNHGGTRQLAVAELSDSELIIFMTQDALLASPDALEVLLKGMRDPRVGAAYGRQLPRRRSSSIEAHARLFNYPTDSHVRDRSDISRFGIKASFLSNSFAVWRRSALVEIGGFPTCLIQNEDAWAASKLIQAGWKIAYCSAATVHHSHGYGFMQEFRRYFDIGVFHADQRWIRDSFGHAGGEGLRFVRSEIKHLLRTNPALIPSALVRT